MGGGSMSSDLNKGRKSDRLTESFDWEKIGGLVINV